MSRRQSGPFDHKRHVRTGERGHYKSQVDHSRSHSSDSHHRAQHAAKPRQGDRGDRKLRWSFA